MHVFKRQNNNRAQARAESNVFVPDLSNQSINQSADQSIIQSINQTVFKMANASSMILSQEACWNDTTYRKHMQTNLDIYDEIHSPNCYCCLVNSSRGRFSNSLFSFLRKMIFVSPSLL